jgi:hypothetical protein
LKIKSIIAPALTLVSLMASLHAQQSVYGGAGPDWWTAGLDSILPREDDYNNATGRVRMVLPNGMVHSKGHPFFEALGSNGRACITCHQPSNGMSVSAAGLRQRWSETEGKDAVFAAVDGSNCPDLPQNSRSSHSLLLDRGLFRIALPWPPRDAAGNAIAPEFRIEVVNDPTGCNTSAIYGLKSAHPAVSVFRRPRVAANLKYVVAGRAGLSFMADGRETTLREQAISAVLTHEAANMPTDQQLEQIVELESEIYIAQGSDVVGGLLNETNGPLVLGPENLVSGRAPRMDGGSGSKPTNLVWLSFNTWRKPAGAGDAGLQAEFRASVARGSDVFFGHRFRISEVSGGRDTAAANGTGTCSSCHSPVMPRFMDIGTANVAESSKSPELPTFRITCDMSAPPHPYSGRVIYTQDPGRALISGKCADVGAFAMQQFRGLAARAPYFVGGSAATLKGVVDFYEQRFHMGLTAQEKQDLENFLRVL